jgi:hypothetical protein
MLCVLRALGRTFHGVACAFGLPYLTPPDAAKFVADAAASSSRVAR